MTKPYIYHADLSDKERPMDGDDELARARADIQILAAALQALYDSAGRVLTCALAEQVEAALELVAPPPEPRCDVPGCGRPLTDAYSGGTTLECPRHR